MSDCGVKLLVRANPSPDPPVSEEISHPDHCTCGKGQCDSVPCNCGKKPKNP